MEKIHEISEGEENFDFALKYTIRFLLVLPIPSS